MDKFWFQLFLMCLKKKVWKYISWGQSQFVIIISFLTSVHRICKTLPGFLKMFVTRIKRLTNSCASEIKTSALLRYRCLKLTRGEQTQ